MKKIITLIVSCLLFVGTIFAQEDTTKTHSKTSAKESKKAANTNKKVKRETKVVKTKTTK